MDEVIHQLVLLKRLRWPFVVLLVIALILATAIGIIEGLVESSLLQSTVGGLYEALYGLSFFGNVTFNYLCLFCKEL